MPRALVDTSVLFAAAYRRDSAHEDALPILRGIDAEDVSRPDVATDPYQPDRARRAPLSGRWTRRAGGVRSGRRGPFGTRRVSINHASGGPRRMPTRTEATSTARRHRLVRPPGFQRDLFIAATEVDVEELPKGLALKERFEARYSGPINHNRLYSDIGVPVVAAVVVLRV